MISAENDKWNRRFMELAKTIAGWSKDEHVKAGAVIVGDNHEIKAMGYNGAEHIRNHDFEHVSWEHAEGNAIHNAILTGTSLKGCTIYSTHYPCIECTRDIIQSGIKKVIVRESASEEYNHRYKNLAQVELSKHMFAEAEVEYKELPNT